MLRFGGRFSAREFRSWISPSVFRETGFHNAMYVGCSTQASKAPRLKEGPACFEFLHSRS